jgi:hypothetical protein
MSLGRLLMVVGLLVFTVGGLIYLVSRLDIPLGRLPGDIRIERENFTCVFPLATSILLSILLTIGLNLLVRFLKR